MAPGCERRGRGVAAALAVELACLVAIRAEVVDVTVSTHSSVYALPTRYAPTSSATSSASRLAGLCRPGALQPNDTATFWLASLWGDIPNRLGLSRLREANVRALQLHPCAVDTPKLQAFLDRAWTEGLTVVPQLPEHLFHGGGCFAAGFDCYDVVRDWARQMLRTALTRDGRYHPVVEMVLLLREPDEAATATCQECGLAEGLLATLSAWDGWLDAENELGVEAGSVGIASLLAAAADGDERTQDRAQVCYNLRSPEGCERSHALRRLWSGANRTAGWAAAIAGEGRIRRGLEQGAYVPHNDLAAAAAERWVHTFRANSSADDVIATLRDYYAFVAPAQPRRDSAALLDFKAP